MLALQTPTWAPRAAAYAVGCVASYWVFARLSSAA
jgi:hypothetical protein